MPTIQGIYKDLFGNTVSLFWVKFIMMMIRSILISMRIRNQYSKWSNMKIVDDCCSYVPVLNICPINRQGPKSATCICEPKHNMKMWNICCSWVPNLSNSSSSCQFIINLKRKPNVLTNLFSLKILTLP